MSTIPNPIPVQARGGLYLALIVAGAGVLLVPDILLAAQTGDWAVATTKASGILTLLGGTIAAQNLTIADPPTPRRAVTPDPEIETDDDDEAGEDDTVIDPEDTGTLTDPE